MKYLTYSVEDFLTHESFINYLEQNNKKDVAFWNRVISSNPHIKEKVEEAKVLYFQLALRRPDKERKGELNRLKQAIELIENPAEKTYANDGNSNKKSKYSWYAMAAAFVVFIGFYAISVFFPTPDEIIAYKLGKDYYQVVAETRSGERKRIELPDGSSVLLNGSSVISIAKDYNQNNRILKVNGEAFFEVAKDESRPFVVIANNTITTALGTSFKIKNYGNLQETSVMLATGKVSVKEISEDIEVVKEELLKPGQQVKVFSYKASEKMCFDQQELADWHQRNLSFSMANLDEIRNKLYDMYGVLVIANNMPKRNNLAFTGTFREESLEDVLDAIAFVNHFTYEKKDGKVYLTFEE